MDAVTWRRDGVEISSPATVTLTARTRPAPKPPRVQVCAARTADGAPAIHLGLFDLPSKQWADGVATIPEAIALALAILAQVLIAEERWAAR